MLLLSLFHLVWQVEALATQSTTPPLTVQHAYTDKGIMALVPVPFLPSTTTNEDHADDRHQVFVAGSKRGTLMKFEWDPLHRRCTCKGEIKDGAPPNTSVPYPIYSLLYHSSCDDKHNDQKQQLFCGSGDRYIKVLERRMESDNNNDWQFRQRLGPHTGWVKALALSSDQQGQPLLHSIGCNCIETWSKLSSDDQQWVHCRKRAIESSPDQGSTLSSDLLCLASWKSWLCAGGVDGRIHVWTSDPEQEASPEPLCSIGAHQGRVNAMVTVTLSDHSCLLLSVGNDGELQCRTMRHDEALVNSNACLSLTEQSVATLSVLDEEDSPMRISSLACTPLINSNKMDIAVRIMLGTTAGVVVDAEMKTDDNWTRIQLVERSRVQLHEESDARTINAIAIMADSDSPRLAALVGHAGGLSVIILDS